MDYYSTKEIAKKWNISSVRVTVLASKGLIPGAVLVGKSWLIPKDAAKPADRRYKNKEQTISSDNKFFFPLFNYSNLTYEEAATKLSPVSYKLYTAQRLFDAAQYKEGGILLDQVISETRDPYILCGALYYKVYECLSAENFEELFVNISKIKNILQQDLVYKSEMSFLLLDLEGLTNGNKIYTDSLNINSDYKFDMTAMPYIIVLSAYATLIKSYVSHQEANSELLETMSILLEAQNYSLSELSVHIYTALYFQIIDNKEKRLNHITKAFRIAEKENRISMLVVFYEYFEKELNQYISENNCINLIKIPELSARYKKNFSNLLEFCNRNNFYTILEQEDFAYIMYARQNLTNKEIAAKEKLSESYINKKYSDLYKKLGVNSKGQLCEVYKKNMNDFE